MFLSFNCKYDAIYGNISSGTHFGSIFSNFSVVADFTSISSLSRSEPKTIPLPIFLVFLLFGRYLKILCLRLFF